MHFSVGTEENHEKVSQNSLYLGRDLNPGPSENEAGAIYSAAMLSDFP
jgi:hypothetical protein